MGKKFLPIGIQDFRHIREEGFYYVDKTSYIHHLTRKKRKFFFLSRPRRFGKSLFVDTLKEAFSGSEELFKGLDIHDKWDWSEQNPIVHLSFGGGNFKLEDEIGESMNKQLTRMESQAGVTTTARRPAYRLQELIEKLRDKSGQDVVVLVDEYERPILESLENSSTAKKNRDELGAIYGMLKDASNQLRFCFFTGVSRFAKTSLFSGMNQFIDISIDPECTAICGYTESDLESVFGAELDGLNRDDIREWYNGYRWLGEEKVYNPYDILYLFETRRFEPWWFMTGSPDFMIETLKRNDVISVDLSRRRSGVELFDSFDIDGIDTESLLFQTGYLTISEIDSSEKDALYTLDYPNREVRQNLNVLLLDILAPGASKNLNDKRGEIAKMLLRCDADGMESLFQAVFAGIPRQWHSRADLTQYESYVASVFYSYFMGTGHIADAEAATSRGRIDLTVTGASYVYIFEFKMVEDEATGEALEQILEMDYAKKYRGAGKSVYLVGVEFSKSKREIVNFDLAEDDGESV